MCVHADSSKTWHSKIQLISLTKYQNLFIVTSNFAEEMKHDHFLYRTENPFLGVMLVDELLGVRGVERRWRYPILYLFRMDSFVESYIFLCIFSSHQLLFHVPLSTLLKGKMLLQYNPVLRGYHKMFHC